jgi:hypothetical protein
MTTLVTGTFAIVSLYGRNGLITLHLTKMGVKTSTAGLGLTMMCFVYGVFGFIAGFAA